MVVIVNINQIIKTITSIRNVLKSISMIQSFYLELKFIIPILKFVSGRFIFIRIVSYFVGWGNLTEISKYQVSYVRVFEIANCSLWNSL